MSSTAKRPLADDWEENRELITLLYSQNTLKEVQRFMLERGFRATLRMYRIRLKAWNLSKNMKFAQKEELLRLIDGSHQTASLASSSGISLSTKELQKLARHSKTLARVKKGTVNRPRQLEWSGNPNHLEPGLGHTKDAYYANHKQAVSHLKCGFMLHRGVGEPLKVLSQGVSELEVSEASARSMSVNNLSIELDYSGDDVFQSKEPNPIQLPSFYISSFSVATGAGVLDMRLILSSVQDLCLVGKFSTTQCGEAEQFWKDIKQSIYLVKTPSRARAWSVLDQAYGRASNMLLTSDVITLLREIFATLSPANNAEYPEIRMQILRYLSDLATSKLGTVHPVTVILHQLQYDGQSREVSEICLSYMVEMLSPGHRDVHPEAFKARVGMVRLLRLDADYNQALIVGQRIWSLAQNQFGLHSLEAQMAGRQLEHIYIDLGNLECALDVCFSIVGQDKDLTGQKHQKSLECSVYTMEDIAAIYHKLGEIDLSIAWLEQAEKSARFLWNEWVAAAHISDKLNSALSRSVR